MATTTNFGWETPDDSDLVKDGAAAMRTLGNSIDASMADLRGGTSGQILSKNSNTDMDFTWIANDQGDITAVTAGTGISGGGTSGAVTITNSMATEITAAGDIIVGTGSGTFDNLPIGTTGQVLTADTTVSPYKVKWAAAAAGGKVLQVVQGTTTTYTTVASTTYTDTNLSASITPSSASSKVLVLVSQNGVGKASTDAQAAIGFRLMRGATEIQEFVQNIFLYGAVHAIRGLSLVFNYLDTPNTTSATTYKTQFRMTNAAYTGYVQDYNVNTYTMSTITLLEIGA